MAQFDVMQQLQNEYGEGQPMSTQDIVREDLRRNGSEQDFPEIYGRLAQGIENNEFRILRSGNNLMVYNIVTPQEEVFFDVLMAGNPNESMKSFGDFLQALKAAGFKVASSYIDRPEFLQFARNANLNMRQEQTNEMSKSGIPFRKITVEL